jgi:hypothetical protein
MGAPGDIDPRVEVFWGPGELGIRVRDMPNRDKVGGGCGKKDFRRFTDLSRVNSSLQITMDVDNCRYNWQKERTKLGGEIKRSQWQTKIYLETVCIDSINMVSRFSRVLVDPSNSCHSCRESFAHLTDPFDTPRYHKLYRFIPIKNVYQVW